MITETSNTRPHRCTSIELKKVGVVLLDKKDISLACENCGRQWSPMVGREGRLPKGYWRCPEGCHVG
jgi:hypothetical protein